MSFLAPALLWGVAAAAVPIILHFLFRSRFRRIPWAAMRFLRESIEQTSRRVRFQELLLLLMRIGLLALLAAALARPVIPSAGGRDGSDPVDAVFLVDVSYSMDAREGDRTRLDVAKAAARRILDQLPLNSTVCVVPASDRAVPASARAIAGSSQAKLLVDSIELSQLSTDLLPALDTTTDALDRGVAVNKEVFVFSDMHRRGWDHQSAAVVERLQELQKRAKIFLIRCGDNRPANASIMELTPPAGVPHAGQRGVANVLVRNSGSELMRNLTVSLGTDESDDRETRAIAELAPGESKSVGLMMRFHRPGLRVLTASLSQDGLAADNRFDRVVAVRDRIRTLVVDGSPGDRVRKPERASAYFLLHALTPVAESERGGHFLQPRWIEPREATPALLREADLCILTNVALDARTAPGGQAVAPQFVDALGDFVRRGGRLLLFGGDRVSPAAYNEALADREKLLPCRLKDFGRAGVEVPSLARKTALDSLAALADEESYRDLDAVPIRRRLNLDEPQAGKACLRFGDGQPAVVVGSQGRVAMVAVSADASWTDLPRWQGIFVPMVHLLVAGLLGNDSAMHNVTAGDSIRFVPPEADAERTWELTDPKNRAAQFVREPDSAGKVAFVLKETPTAGVYRWTAPPNSVPFAVVPDPTETERLDAISDAEIDGRLGFSPVHATANADLADFAPRTQNYREYAVSLLWIVCALCLAEAGMAWWCGRDR